jgi:uncharacterized membrane protein
LGLFVSGQAICGTYVQVLLLRLLLFNRSTVLLLCFYPILWLAVLSFSAAAWLAVAWSAVTGEWHAVVASPDSAVTRFVCCLVCCVQEEQRELANTIRVSGSILLSTVSNFLDFFK